MDAFITNPREEPRLNERLELEVLDLIARSTAGPRPVDGGELGPAGRRPDEVRRQLRAIRDERLIRYIDLGNHADPDAMKVLDLKPAGWARLEELRQRYNRRARWALARSWPAVERWIVPLLTAVVGAARRWARGWSPSDRRGGLGEHPQLGDRRVRLAGGRPLALVPQPRACLRSSRRAGAGSAVPPRS